MKYGITPQTESLVAELRELASQIDDRLLARASGAAREEWAAIRDAWPTEDEVHRGTLHLSEDDLAWMVEKVRRFKSILRGLAPGQPDDEHAPVRFAPPPSADLRA
jgi:hypothetical protein